MFKGHLVISYLILLVLAVINLYPVVSHLLEARPYSNVELIAKNEKEDGTDLVFHFTKNGSCSITNFTVVGYSNGFPQQVVYEELNEAIAKVMRETGGLFDRQEGDQTLNISVKATSLEYDKIEIRTRHRCERADGSEVKVSKVFAVVPLVKIFEY